MKDLKTANGNTYCLSIADTVIITAHGPQNITSGVSKDFKDISYTLDDENEDEEGSEEEMKDTARNNVILEKRTRGAAAA